MMAFKTVWCSDRCKDIRKRDEQKIAVNVFDAFVDVSHFYKYHKYLHGHHKVSFAATNICICMN